MWNGRADRSRRSSWTGRGRQRPQEPRSLVDDVLDRVGGGAVDLDFVMEVGTGREARVPDLSDDVSPLQDRKSTRLNSSHGYISYAVFCLKKKKKKQISYTRLRH